MPRQGLIPDPLDEQTRRLDPEREDQRALERWRSLPTIDQQIVELRALREQLQWGIDQGLMDDDATQANVAELTAGLKRLEKISARQRKAEAKRDTAHDRLAAKLRAVTDAVPSAGDAPINRMVKKLKEDLDKHDADQSFDRGWAGMTDRERINLGYRWLNDLTANDCEAARKMGYDDKAIAEFKKKLDDLDRIITAEERNRGLVDPSTPAARANADWLLDRMDSGSKKAIYITPNDILGKKGN